MSASRTTVTLLVCSLVLLAGCGNPLGGGDDRGQYDVPERYPPGVSGSGVDDAYELAGAHRDQLRNSSRTVEDRSVARYENGTLLQEAESTTLLDGAGGYYGVGTTRGTHVRSDERTAEWWSNGSVGVAMYLQGDDRSYRRNRGTRIDRVRLNRFVSLLVQLEPEHVGKTTRDGRQVHVLAAEGDEVPRQVDFLRLENVRNVSFKAWVDPRGIVREWHLEYTGDWNDRTIRFEQRMRITGVDETTVPRPDWTDEALNRTEPLGSTAGATGDRGRVDRRSNFVTRVPAATDPRAASAP